MIVAHTTIVFMRYIILALSARENNDDKTIGDLFFASCDEIKDITIFDAFAYLTTYLILSISKKMKREASQVSKLVYSFLDSLPLNYKTIFIPKPCET